MLNRCIKSILAPYILLFFVSMPLIIFFYVPGTNRAPNWCSNFLLECERFLFIMFYGGLLLNFFIIPFFTFIYLSFLDLTKSTEKKFFYFVLNLLVLLVVSFATNFLPLCLMFGTPYSNNSSYYSYIIRIVVTTFTLLSTVMGTMVVVSRIDATKKICRIAALIAFLFFLGFAVFFYRG
jgi:hypothetical protein